MEYRKIALALRKNKLYLFTLEDVKNLFPGEKEKTMKNNLTRWISKGYFTRLRRNLYEFSREGEGLTIPDLYAANRVYSPSYVSLETALSFYSIIPDVAAAVTSVTSRGTRVFKNKYGLFIYKTCRGRAFVGYKLMLYEGFKVCIADKEKALADFLYYRLRAGQILDFQQERFNKKILKQVNWKKVFNYAKLFNNKTVKTVKKCKEYAEC